MQQIQYLPGMRAPDPPWTPFVTYLAGPMENTPNHNFPSFYEWAGELAFLGHSVINPARNFSGQTDLPRSYYLSLDLTLVLEAEGVALMPGWSHSQGAKLEFLAAHETDKFIFLLGNAESIPNVLNMEILV